LEYWNKQVFTSILLGILFSILFASIPFIESASAQQSSLPEPILRFTTAEEYYVDVSQYFRYHLTIDNWESYPQTLFYKPDPRGCGLLDNSARTLRHFDN